MITLQETGVAPADSLARRREQAFCGNAGAEVFHSVVSPPQIWTTDPFDVETIHAEAREVFGRLIQRASNTPTPQTGRVLLLQGESGSGKTHLMRAFRNVTHSMGHGYFGYLQMTSSASNYSRYVLNNLIESLDQPYLTPNIESSGLMRLSTGLLEAILPADEVQKFRDGHISPSELPREIDRLARLAALDSRFSGCDVDLVRAMLYLQREDAYLNSRILAWLRCEDLSINDRELLSNLVPRTQDESPLRTVIQLGRLMSAVHGAALVLCVDQLEDTYIDQQGGPERFRRVMSTVLEISTHVPTSVVILACLEDYYVANRRELTASWLDRLEHDPEPVRLTGSRTAEEIKELVARRMEFFFEDLSIEPDSASPCFPFTQADLEKLAGLRTRDVLNHCRRYREKSIQEGRLAEAKDPDPQPPDDETLEQCWNDFHTAYKARVPDDEGERAELLASAIRDCSPEVSQTHHFSATPEGRMIQVEFHGPNNAVTRRLVAVCERSAKGGGLGIQVAEVEKEAGEIPAVLVRSTPFPTTPTAAVFKQIARIIKKKGGRVVVADADWRKMLAFRDFPERIRQTMAVAAWQRKTRPLSQIPAIRAVLDLQQVDPDVVEVPRPAPVAPPITRPPDNAGLLLGTNRSAVPSEILVDPEELKMHAAFLGGSGSGKTTAALNLIEQLLSRGVPVVLLDRKGDLCRYADPEAWRPTGDKTADEKRQTLRQRIEVTLYTPGKSDGRPLVLPVAPPGLDKLSTADREQVAGLAAAALGNMMGLKLRGNDAKCRAILAKAFEVLGAASGQTVTVPQLRTLVQDRDAALLTAVGGFDDRVYGKLGDDLLTLWLNQRSLIDAAAEPLDVGALLASTSGNRTRLTVISTKFLGSADCVDFWVAQFLMAVGRWCAKTPAPHLQAAFFFDEADQYLPATRQPSTKAPMEDLLRRARSAGVGILLATQSPGDFDYRCRDNIRTWMVGRVREVPALNKLRPLFAESRIDATDKLPGQEAGQFYLVREREARAVQSARSLLPTEQLGEDRIVMLARGARGAGTP